MVELHKVAQSKHLLTTSSGRTNLDANQGKWTRITAVPKNFYGRIFKLQIKQVDGNTPRVLMSS